ncbi:MAG: hypothetical protein KatS3mg035_0779 [Bacteroidia bacterium]|nr:MAG: hypothetical protein KatS3mg035_0779 [Bacteroidia bacterium]
MKKLYLVLSFLWAFCQIQAQNSFDWIAKGDTIKSIPVADSIVLFDGDLKNNTNKVLDLLIIKQSVVNPKNWAHYICSAGTCYPPNQDTVRINLNPNETIEMRYDVDVISPTNGDVATFKVTIMNNQNSDEFITRTFRVNVNQTNKIKNLVQVFSVYPNPVSSTLFVKNSSQSITYTEILNTSGQILSTHHENFIDVQKLPSGIYFLKIYTTEGYTEYHQFIKQ